MVGKKCIRHYAADRVLAKSGDTKFYRYSCEPECRAVDTAENATILSSKNFPHTTAVKVVVSVQLFPGLQLA